MRVIRIVVFFLIGYVLVVFAGAVATEVVNAYYESNDNPPVTFTEERG